VPVIICSGCGHDIPAPRGSALIQCRDCGRKMQVKAISPAAQSTRAT
jgi:DNA-directed RNA polymerase subunit RPC12/RpoP